ncbi:MAG: T9SS type A sorting domain-containing protein [Bacteroidetes bacterium]|jgi:hypothetical protein|nr:T9SS type A sorting domain-containing protein [Bacteroidota bacterium]
MVRPACYTKIFLDENESYYSGYLARTEFFQSPLDTVDIDISDKNIMKIEAFPDGYQYEPFEEHDVFVSRCPWLDNMNYADAKLYFIKSLKGIALARSELTIDQHERDTLVVSFDPDTAYMKHVKFESMNTSAVRIVDARNGIIEGHGIGKATVIATSFDGNYQDSSIVTVNPLVGVFNTHEENKNIPLKSPSPLSNIEINLSEYSGISAVQVNIYSLTGKLLYANNTNSTSLNINLQGIAQPGLCVVQLITNHKSDSKIVLLHE